MYAVQNTATPCILPLRLEISSYETELGTTPPRLAIMVMSLDVFGASEREILTFRCRQRQVILVDFETKLS